MTIVTSSFFAGAEMITFLAPPLSTCTRALVASVNNPVDSITTSAPTSLHGSFAGSRSSNALKVCPPALIVSAVELTSPGKRPRMVS